MTDPYPLVLEPILKEKVWGGRRLERLGKTLAPGVLIGESWEVADLGATSASGGGGGAAHSRILNGALAGRTVRDAVAAWGGGILGSAAARDGAFPLLVKYLDAREHLSVQVHPSPAYAAAHAGAHLKTESWVVLEADRGLDGSDPVIYVGLTPGTRASELRRAIESGRVPEVLVARPAVVGECHTLPSGTVHALGAGVLVAEVQTPSDTTFRVYDWTREYGRPVRELHVEQALASALFERPPAAVAARGARSVVARTAFYTIELIRADGGAVPLAPDAHEPGASATGRSPPGILGPLVVMLPRAAGATLTSDSRAWDDVDLAPGQTALVPAACAHGATLRASHGPGTGPETLAVVATPR